MSDTKPKIQAAQRTSHRINAKKKKTKKKPNTYKHITLKLQKIKNKT